MAAVVTVKSLTVKDNYHLLQNADVDKINVINQIIPPAWATEGFLLCLEFDNLNKGGGIFLKNKAAGDDNANMRLQCISKRLNQVALISKLSEGHNVLYYIIGALYKAHDALAHVIAETDPSTDMTDLAAKIASADNDTFLETGIEAWEQIRNGAFAYGVGGADFLAGFAVKDTKAGVDYYDYSARPPFVMLMWDGAAWKQATNSNNAIS